MSRTRIGIIMILGIMLGVVGTVIAQTWNQYQKPLISGQNIDLQSLISSIKQNYVAKSEYNYGRFDEIYKLLQENYYDTGVLDEHTMIEQAIKAYVNAIQDPYTVYLDTQTNNSFQEDLKGESDFEGIGAVVTKKDYYIMIEEVLKNSPAYKAGLYPLDRIIAINGTATQNLDLNEGVAMIRGPQGTQVTLTIERRSNDTDKEIIEMQVTRDKLVIPSVTNEIIDHQSKKICYINISVIGEETERLMQNAILDCKNNKTRGIILDLRGNGGGFLPIGVQIASHFIPKGSTVVIAKYRGYPDETYNSLGHGDFSDEPTIVLIDYLTASAGEIIALALQEQIGATLLGTQTFGKGSIQTLHEFGDGNAIKYTIGKWYSPSGKNIDNTGITPDVLIEFDTEKYTQHRQDNQLQEAITLIGEKIR